MSTTRLDQIEIQRHEQNRRARRRAKGDSGPSRFAFPSITPTRKLPGWAGWNLSADATILPDLENLRARSRELALSSSVAVSMFGRLVDNVVGTGIRMQSRPDQETLGVDPEEARVFSRTSERGWERWGPFADVTGRLTIGQLQALAVRQFLEDGEFFLVRHMVKSARRPYRLCWDIIDPDRVQSPNGVDSNSDPVIRSGVELDDAGAPAAYWIRVGHPGDAQYSRAEYRWRRIPAFDPDGRPNVIHRYQMVRPGQTRGIPVLAPLLALFTDMEELQKATLYRERMAACYAAMITTMDPQLASEAQAAANARVGVNGTEREEELYPGMVAYLEPGQSVTFGTPTGLSQPTENLVRGIVMQLGAALGIPYFLTTLDMRQVNFSSGRTGLLEFWRRVRILQKTVVVDGILIPSWKLLLEEMHLAGEFGLIFYDDEVSRSAWSRARGVAEGKGMVEPVKEVEASKLAMDTRVSTLADECAIHGRDWEEVLEQVQREQERADELGVELRPPKEDPATVPAGAPGEDDEDADEGATASDED